MEIANPPIKAMEVITPIVVIARNFKRRDILLACVVSKGSKVPSFSPAPRLLLMLWDLRRILLASWVA